MYIYKNSNAFPHNKIKIAVGERELPVSMINQKKKPFTSNNLLKKPYYYSISVKMVIHFKNILFCIILCLKKGCFS